MPVDGTYGRLSGHNQRSKELRRKKRERKERNHILNINSVNENKAHFNTVKPEKLNAIKLEIQKRAKRKRFIEYSLFVFSLVIAYIIFYVLFVK